MQGLSLSEAWEILTDKLINFIENHVPVSKVSNDSGKKNPYVTHQCKTAIKKKHTKWLKFQYCKSDQHYDEYKVARNIVTSELRKSKYCYEKDLAKKIKTDSKLFWSYVRSKTRTKTSIGQLETPDGNCTNESSEKAEILNNYFASVFESEGSETLPDFEDRNFEPLTDIEITQSKVSKAIDKLKPSKSQGPDNIHPKLIKECKESLLEPLEIIFKKSLESSKIPEIWKEGYITAIFKSGPKTKAENYRPISLTSVPGKLLERLIRDEIVKHMEDNSLLSDAQHGFVKGRSCTTQLLELMEELTDALDSNEDIDIIYLDFRKAFDKVPHKRLLKKLWGYGIRGKVYSWVKEFLSDRSQKVVVNGRQSKTAKVTSGIPQGSVLGPILFLVFINDLPDTIIACMKLFADDAKIFGRVNTIRQAETVQTSLNNAVDWARIWKMNYHLKKCKHLHIGNHDINYQYKMETEQESIIVEKVTTEKDLGVTIDTSLKFSEHINNKVNKANRNVGLIFRTFTFMDPEMFLNLYKSIVRPHLEYAATIWSPMFKKDKVIIENVQRRATRLVKSIQHLSYPERLRSLGLPSLEYRRDRADLIQVYKILHDIDKVDKDKLFTRSTYTSTRGHSLKLFKKRFRLQIRANFFSNRVVENWNSLSEDIVNTPSLNAFKSRLNRFWHQHPCKFNPSCYAPGPTSRGARTFNQNASTEANRPV